jgi:hypothetical protein
MTRDKATQSDRACSKCGSTWVRTIFVARVSLYRDAETGEIVDDINMLDDKPVPVAAQCLDCRSERALGSDLSGLMRTYFYSPLPPKGVSSRSAN